jgi:hypothetical protein
MATKATPVSRPPGTAGAGRRAPPTPGRAGVLEGTGPVHREAGVKGPLRDTNLAGKFRDDPESRPVFRRATARG